ncbi:MAG: trypsin-like serine protease [Bacteriovorax sp.]|nr:trypsin-like serine protease [Bacteriovorax sp.]
MKYSNHQKLNAFFLGTMIFSTLSLVACGANKDIPKTAELEVSDIVNGKTVTKKNENAHSLVALVAEKNSGQSLCTGTIIAPGVVLTAAHCVDEAPQKLHIVFGLNIQKKTNKKDIREADKFVIHPNWGRHLPSGESDLALIHFKGALPEGYSPVKLANDNLKLKIGQKVLMLGYGVTDGQSESGSGKLRQTNSFVLEEHSPTEIMTDGQKSSVCFGDSGGPAFVKVLKEYVQWGVASSVTNKSCNEASIHTEVMKYETWIKSSVSKMQH